MNTCQFTVNWREKGVLSREANSLSSLLLNYLAIAVDECSNIEEARAWFASQDYASVLARYQDVLASLTARIDAGEVPSSTIAGNYRHLVFTHLTWALSDFGAGKHCARIAARSDVLELSTPFWCEYAMAIQKLIDGEPYKIGDIDVQGQEGYWLSYLRLIERATNNQETASAVAAINDAFARRNLDITIKDDAHEIEGSGGHPVRWDFRRDGLLSYIGSKE